MNANLVLWTLYFALAALALYVGWHPGLTSLETPLCGVKLIVWFVFAAFLAYSLYCSRRENLVSTIRYVAQRHWGRQIGADLYIGLFLSLFLIHLNQGLTVALLWTVPTLLFGNLAVLLYVSIYFDSIVAHFVT